MNDLRRVHQLLVSSLAKLQTKTKTIQLYNESLVTLEKLAILTAWAEVYIKAITNNDLSYNIANRQNYVKNISENCKKIENQESCLLSLVQPELNGLSSHWLAALKDHALLSLPAEYGSQLPHDGGAFYTTDTMESSKQYYCTSWPSILHATALWIYTEECQLNKNDNVDNTANIYDSLTNDSNVFHLLFGK